MDGELCVCSLSEAKEVPVGGRGCSSSQGEFQNKQAMTMHHQKGIVAAEHVRGH